MKSNIISFFTIFLAFSTVSLAQDEVDCSDFRKGKFSYTPPNGGEVIIRRTKKKQIERYNDENQKFIFEITWLDDCRYELILVNTKGLPKEKKKEIIGTSLQCKVVAASLGHYEVEITSESSFKPQKLSIYSN